MNTIMNNTLNHLDTNSLPMPMLNELVVCSEPSDWCGDVEE